MTKKKKKPTRAKKKPLLADTAELAGDANNPRKISEEAAEGLQNSLDRFGDLSGITWNRRTNELVCGHQHMSQIRAKWGDRPIKIVDTSRELGIIEIDDKHCFTVRVVDWSPALQRAANVAANNQKIAGQFTDDLSSYLLEVQADLQEEAPGILNDLLLVDLIDIDLEEDLKNTDLPECYQVTVDCESEHQQQEVHALLTKKGWKCRVLTA